MRLRSRVTAGLLAGTLVIFGLTLIRGSVATAAQAVPGHTRLVPTTPRNNVARIMNGDILDIEVIGTRVYIAGTFTSIQNPNGTNVAQRWLAAYNIDTGVVDATFRPTFDGNVNAIERSPDGASLFVAGSFNTVGGVTKRKIAKISPTTGAPVTAFTANANARATAIAVSTTTVYVGGQFATVNSSSRGGLVALNATTGAVDALNLPLTGGIGPGGLLTVQQLKLTHNETKLLVVHTARQIAGQDRYGVALVDTATRALLPWRTRLWEDNLSFVGGIQRVAAGDISPDDSYFVVTSGSGGDRPPINDTAIRFPINGNDNVEPQWVSRHFDSVYSVAITERAVYVGGHFSWQESPTANQPWPGLDNVGYGTGQGLSGYSLGDQVVRRDHLGALDPVSGTALEWNPGSNSFEGDQAMKATPRGLFVGGDGNVKGGRTIGRVAFFDFNSEPAPSAVETTIVNPIEGAVKPAGEQFTISGQAVAPAGVTRVQVEIQDRNSKQFLQDDLVSWGANNNVLATVATVSATNTPWSLSVSLPGGMYQIMAKTFGGNSTSDPTKAIKKIEAFSFDDLPPTTRITGPPSGLLATTSFIATGTASDDSGVNAMSYWFRTGNNLYLQDDGTVGPNFNTFSGEPDVVGLPSATWQFEVNLPVEGEWRMSATAIDDAGQPDLRSEVRDWIVTSTGSPPSVTITSPVAMTPPTSVPAVVVAPGGTMSFAGTATDTTGLSTVEIFLRNNTTREALAADGTWGVNSVAAFHRVSPINLSGTSYDWSYTSVPLTPGLYTFQVRATNTLGLTTTSSNYGRLSITAQVPGDAFPNGLLNFTGTDQNIDVLHLNLAGTATDNFGVSAVRVALRDLDTGRYVQPNGTMSTGFATVNATLGSPGATSTTFTLSIDLPTKGEFSVEAFAIDTAGQQDTSTNGATARYLVYPGDTDPTLETANYTPVEGHAYTDQRIVVGGRAVDDVGISRVEVQIVNSLNQGMNSSGNFGSSQPWISVFLTSPGSPGSNFSYTSPVIPAGSYSVRVRAIDNYGQVQQTPRVTAVTVA